jgi:hypothetical protein
VLAEGFQRNYFKSALVRRGEDHECRRPVAMRTEPICCGNAPPIAPHKTRKTVVWHRGTQIVADGQLMLEKLGSDHRADGVASMVFGSGLATPVTVEPRHGVDTAWLQFSTYDVSIDHGPSIAEKSPYFEVSSSDGLYFGKEPLAGYLRNSHSPSGVRTLKSASFRRHTVLGNPVTHSSRSPYRAGTESLCASAGRQGRFGSPTAGELAS